MKLTVELILEDESLPFPTKSYLVSRDDGCQFYLRWCPNNTAAQSATPHDSFSYEWCLLIPCQQMIYDWKTLKERFKKEYQHTPSSCQEHHINEMSDEIPKHLFINNRVLYFDIDLGKSDVLKILEDGNLLF